MLVLAHGESTATSMASVANRLLNCDHVKGIDMPLDKSVDETYDKVLSTVKALDKGKGVIFISRYGLLGHFW